MSTTAISPVPSVTFRECPSYDEFIAARANSDRGAYLSPISSDEFSRGHSYLSNDGAVGYRIVDGDLQSVFNNSDIRGAGAAAVLDAIARGARTLDCFDGFLPAYYARFGFVEVSRDEWNDAYAPADWNYAENGRPDVVYMRYHGGNPANLGTRYLLGTRCLTGS